MINHFDYVRNARKFCPVNLKVFSSYVYWCYAELFTVLICAMLWFYTSYRRWKPCISWQFLCDESHGFLHENDWGIGKSTTFSSFWKLLLFLSYVMALGPKQIHKDKFWWGSYFTKVAGSRFLKHLREINTLRRYFRSPNWV